MNKLFFTLLVAVLLGAQAGCDFDILLDDFDRVGYVSDYGGGDGYDTWYVTETVYYDEPAYYVEESYVEEVWVEEDWYYDDWYEEEWYDEEYYQDDWYEEEWYDEEWYEEEPYFWWWP